MSVYKYKAKKGPQEVIEDTIVADSETDAIEKVNELGLIPLRIEEQVSAPVKAAPAQEQPARGVKIGSREITVFTRQLASLLKAGVPILQSLTIIAEQSENPRLKRLLGRVRNDVKDGAAFSESLAAFPAVFSPLYIAMIRSGESSGALPEVLFRTAQHRQREEEVFSHLRMALAYPTLMAIVGLGTIIFMLTFVMPRMMNIFNTMEQELPLATRIVISVSQWLRQWWVWAVVLFVAAAAGGASRTKKGHLFLSGIRLATPIMGRLTLKIELSRFCRTLELLLKSGIPILKAIEVAAPVVGNEIIREKLLQTYQDLEQGGSLGKSLKDLRLFPLFMTNLITVGEESGKLGDALGEVADSYERDSDEAIRIATNLLEPLMILGMGLIVGFIVIAMLLPVFEINLMVH